MALFNSLVEHYDNFYTNVAAKIYNTDSNTIYVPSSFDSLENREVVVDDNIK